MRDSEASQHTFLSLGSNLNPGHNVSEMVLGLLEFTPVVNVSRVIRTPPVGMASDNEFLNLCVHFVTDLVPEAIKPRLNAIEMRLGRDRSDPASATKDRPADLDILFQLRQGSRQIRSDRVPAEPYVRPLFLELIHALGFACTLPPVALPAGVPLRLGGRFAGIQPMRVTRWGDGRVRVAHLPLRPVPTSFQEDVR